MADNPPRPLPKTGTNGVPIRAISNYDGGVVWVDDNGQVYDDSGNPTGQGYNRAETANGNKLYDESGLKPRTAQQGNVGFDQNGNPLLPGSVTQGMGGPNFAAATGGNADAYKMLQMHLAALSNQAYRPAMAGARTDALKSSLEAYRPMNNVMGAMYGPQGQIDMDRVSQNPLSQAMMRLGAPNQNDIGIAPPGSPNAAGYMKGPVGAPASAAAKVTYPDQSITVGPPPAAGAPPAGLHRGPDGKLYDAQGKLVG